MFHHFRLIKNGLLLFVGTQVALTQMFITTLCSHEGTKTDTGLERLLAWRGGRCCVRLHQWGTLKFDERFN